MYGGSGKWNVGDENFRRRRRRRRGLTFEEESVTEMYEIVPGFTLEEHSLSLLISGRGFVSVNKTSKQLQVAPPDKNNEYDYVMREELTFNPKISKMILHIL